MNLKKCTFYVSMDGEACAIDAWTENDKIYSTIYEGYSEAEGKPENYFCKCSVFVGNHMYGRI